MDRSQFRVVLASAPGNDKLRKQYLPRHRYLFPCLSSLFYSPTTNALDWASFQQKEKYPEIVACTLSESRCGGCRRMVIGFACFSDLGNLFLGRLSLASRPIFIVSCLEWNISVCLRGELAALVFMPRFMDAHLLQSCGQRAKRSDTSPWRNLHLPAISNSRKKAQPITIFFSQEFTT